VHRRSPWHKHSDFGQSHQRVWIQSQGFLIVSEMARKHRTDSTRPRQFLRTRARSWRKHPVTRLGFLVLATAIGPQDFWREPGMLRCDAGAIRLECRPRQKRHYECRLRRADPRAQSGRLIGHGEAQRREAGEFDRVWQERTLPIRSTTLPMENNEPFLVSLQNRSRSQLASGAVHTGASLCSP